jgi:hypothetical protein
MKKLIFATRVAVIFACLATAGLISRFGVHATQGQGVFSQPAWAQEQSRQSEVRDLTIRLGSLNARYQMAEKAERGSLEQELRSVAAKRHEMLAALIENDPSEVLRVALPEAFGANLPSDVQKNLEQHVDLAGELEVLYRESETESQILYSLNSSNERLSLHFTMRPDKDLLTGTSVRVKGVRIGDAIALEGGADQATSTSTGIQATQTMASISPNTFGEQKVLVLLVNFQDKATQPWTTTQVQDLVFNQVNNFYKESSYQQTWLTGDVFGWYTLPISSATCDQDSIATYARQAATAAGVNLSAYNRHVYAFPALSCGWTGWGTYGGNPSQAWINGSMSVRTVGHELGHGFGLYHARAMDCGSDVVGTNCSVIEYGDSLDILGQSGVVAHSFAGQKERLGWLGYGTSPGITTVQADGTYWIDPYETQGTNPKALKILKSTNATTGVKTWYYVEFRRPVGFDSFISSNSNVMNGVVVHTGTEGYSFDEYLLDMTPSTSSFSDAALVVGRSYNDVDINMTITPLSVSNTGAAVSVSFGPQPCVQANPSMTLSPSTSQWVPAGATMNYQISLTNNNSGCSSSNFNLQAALPSGWSATFDSPTVSILPGSSATVNLSVTSPSSAADGFYSVGVMALNSAAPDYTASGSVTCSIMSGLAVSLASDQALYTRSQTAIVTTMVSALGSPVSGASVSFTMTKPNGLKVTGTATTGINGSAVFKYRFNKQKDPVGIYQVSTVANLNGVVGSGTTSFSVK